METVTLPFANRTQAGEMLARVVAGLGLDHPLVLAVPRGGLPVAAPVAEATGGDLDVVVVRKLGAPRNPELGLGAVGATGEPVIDWDLVRRLGVSARYLEEEVARQRLEALRRLTAYRGDRPLPDLGGRDVAVVDDGIATGGTVSAAGRLLRTAGPRRLVLAVPVSSAESLSRLRDDYDDVVCLATPEPFWAVGQWYEDFGQLSDADVAALLGAG